MAFCPITLPKKLEEIKKALAWASRGRIFWKNQAGDRQREPQKTFGTLAIRKIEKVGIDETRFEDTTDPEYKGPAGNPDYPLNEIIVAQRIIHLQLEFLSRSQELEDSGWYAAETARTRITSEYARNTWLKPNETSVANLLDVIDQQVKVGHDNRIEDMAIFELSFNTVLEEKDAAMVVSYIDSLSISSDLKNAGGESLDSSLQWDNEVV